MDAIPLIPVLVLNMIKNILKFIKSIFLILEEIKCQSFYLKLSPDRKIISRWSDPFWSTPHKILSKNKEETHS